MFNCSEKDVMTAQVSEKFSVASFENEGRRVRAKEFEWLLRSGSLTYKDVNDTLFLF